MSDRLKALADAGVSIWLDDLSRDRITSGNLAELVARLARQRRHHQPDDLRRGPVQGRAYDDQVRELAARGRRSCTTPSRR